jgi:hypothetical protein
MKIKLATIIIAIANGLSAVDAPARELISSDYLFCTKTIPIGTDPTKLKSKVRCNGKLYELKYDGRGHLRYFLIENKNIKKK